MRIAQVAPLSESVPPKRYGGVERIIAYLTDELVSQGHDVTLFASGDSVTRAYLEPVCPRAERLPAGPAMRRHRTMAEVLEQTFRGSQRFDVIHSHLEEFTFPLARHCRTPILHTVHGRLDLPERREVFGRYPSVPLVSISQAQREFLPALNWRGTVHHGLPRSLYRFHPEGGQYLAFLGRFAVEKYPDVAIEIAKRANVPLRMAAKIDPTDETYFQRSIAPLLAHPLVDYVGEISDKEKDPFLGEAAALLAPFDWPEPFGLVFLEALACGTPVIALRRGSVPEIIEDRRTGFICDSVESMMKAIAALPTLNRTHCRASFESQFTSERMAADYVTLYQDLLSGP